MIVCILFREVGAQQFVDIFMSQPHPVLIIMSVRSGIEKNLDNLPSAAEQSRTLAEENMKTDCSMLRSGLEWTRS